MLVGTSYYSTASPFIRYCTGDLVRPTEEDSGLLRSFEVEQGREGEYVTDRKGKCIPLTGLVFGRHHRIFDLAKSVQVYQEAQGRLTFLVSLKKGRLSVMPEEIGQYFDLRGVEMDFELRWVDGPVRTRSGKANLLVQDVPSAEQGADIPLSLRGDQ
jgi:phenylacetate-CoA ligase